MEHVQTVNRPAAKPPEALCMLPQELLEPRTHQEPFTLSSVFLSEDRQNVCLLELCFLMLELLHMMATTAR